MEAKNRVVVTGMGVVAPNGIGLDAFWDSLISCKSGIGPITQFDTEGLKCQIAGEVRNFNLADFIDPRQGKRMSRASQLAVAAAKLAFGDAGIDYTRLSYLPIVMGVSTTAMDLRAKPSRPWSAVQGIPHAVGSAVAYTLGVSAELMTLSDGCASGLDAIAAATKKILDGSHDLVLAGAADSSIERYSFECFDKSRKISVRNDAPQQSCRPFDRERDGGVVSEGAGLVILENLDHALARKAKLYAEIIGFGSSADIPNSEEASGFNTSMRLALTNSSLLPSDISMISAHAPSDPDVDKIEIRAIKQVFGDFAYNIPVTSIKGVTGNAMGAGCAHQFIAAALSVQKAFITPTANLVNPDPNCDLDHVPLKGRAQKINFCLINAHGFGRGNSTLILKKISDDT